MRRAEHNGRSTIVKETEARSNHCLLINRIAESGTRREVVLVFRTSARVDVEGGEQRIGIFHRRTRQSLIVITQTEIQRQLRIPVKIILAKEGIFRNVRMSCASGRAGARKVLRV